MYKQKPPKIFLNITKSSDILKSQPPCGRRLLQLEPWRPHWSTQTHISISPFHGPRGAAGLGNPPACLGTLSTPAIGQKPS